MQPIRFPLLLVAVLLLTTACSGAHDQLPGNRDDHTPWSGIAKAETIRFAGTEPFWSAEASGDQLIYRTPENPEGERIAITRFAGRGGVSFSGTRAAGPMTLAVTPRVCSDGMSDRRYPFIATLQIGGDVRQGCAWTDRQPATGGERP